MRLLVATTNRQQAARDPRRSSPASTSSSRTLDAVPADLPNPRRPGRTFAENARQKACYYASASSACRRVAEDSGFEVDALGGEPGVHSARFGGAERHLREKFAHDLPATARARTALGSPARFVCALAVARADRILFETRGTVEGRRRADGPRGDTAGSATTRSSSTRRTAGRWPQLTEDEKAARQPPRPGLPAVARRPRGRPDAAPAMTATQPDAPPPNRSRPDGRAPRRVAGRVVPLQDPVRGPEGLPRRQGRGERPEREAAPGARTSATRCASPARPAATAGRQVRALAEHHLPEGRRPSPLRGHDAAADARGTGRPRARAPLLEVAASCGAARAGPSRATAAAEGEGGGGVASGLGVRDSGFGIQDVQAPRVTITCTPPGSWPYSFFCLPRCSPRRRAPPVAGAWEGTLDAMGSKLRIGVLIATLPDGQLSATMDSPDQGAYGLPLDGVAFRRRAEVRVDAANGSVRGKAERRGHRDLGHVERRGSRCRSCSGGS